MKTKTAIGIVDAQKDFMESTGALSVTNAHSIKHVIREVIRFGRDRGIEVYYTEDEHDGSEPEMICNGGPFPFHCMANTNGQKIINEAVPVKGEQVFKKKCYDVFDPKLGNPDITEWLKKKKITEVYLAGVATDYCVKAHALGLRKLGINVYVFQDAVKGVDEVTTNDAIAEMKTAGVHFARFVV